MGEPLEELAIRLASIARRVENVGLIRAAEDIRKIADDLKRLAPPATAMPPQPPLPKP